MGLTTYGRNRVLDSVLGDDRSTLFPATIYFALFTTPPNVSGTSYVEPTGNGYARVSKANDNTSWLDAVSAEKANGGLITFPTCITNSWGTVTHWGIFDAATVGNCIYFGALTSPLTVSVSATPFFDTGDLIITAE
jgi:hypothetical protein